MERNLIVLINDFPYNYGEPFFESELPYLEKLFNKIYVFSVYGKKNETPKRSFNLNTVSIPLGLNHNRFKYILRGLFLKSKDFTFKGNSKGFKQFLAAAYVRGKNKSIYNKVWKFLKLNNIDLNDVIIYSYWLTLGMSACLIRNKIQSTLTKIVPAVSRGHRYDIYSEITALNYQPFQRAVINCLDKVFICSTQGQEYLQEKYSDLRNKISVAYLGSKDLGKVFKPRTNNSKTIFLSVSGARKVKRLPFFVDSLYELKKQTENFIWVYIGDGPEMDEIKKRIADYNLENNVRLFGYMSNDDVYNYYKQNDIDYFVNVSESEGLPVSIMEATSFGIPIIATNVGGSGEIVDNQNGFLIKKDIVKEDLANVLLYAIKVNKTDDYLLLRKNSRVRWKEKFNGDKNFQSWANYLFGLGSQ